MITEVKNFIEDFITAELKAKEAYVKPDKDLANKKLDILNSFCLPDLYDTFGMVKQVFPKPPAFYKQHENTRYFARQLFKISQYKNEKYGDLYLAYTSYTSTISKPLSISECLFTARINNDFKIIRTFFFGGDNPTPQWNSGPGDRDISFETAGDLIRIERYLEPKEDSYSMAEYNKEI